MLHYLGIKLQKRSFLRCCLIMVDLTSFSLLISAITLVIFVFIFGKVYTLCLYVYAFVDFFFCYWSKWECKIMSVVVSIHNFTQLWRFFASENPRNVKRVHYFTIKFKNLIVVFILESIHDAQIYAFTYLLNKRLFSIKIINLSSWNPWPQYNIEFSPYSYLSV